MADTENGIVASVRPALALFAAFFLIVGIAYPLLVFIAGNLLFPKAAQGSLVYSQSGALTGSAIIGQMFSSPGYFWPRPSSTFGTEYNASSSGGSGIAISGKQHAEEMKKAALAYGIVGAENKLESGMVTSSASGLDPDISMENARLQAARVAKARGISEADVIALVDSTAEHPDFGIFGTTRVNVLLLNLALDKTAGKPK